MSTQDLSDLRDSSNSGTQPSDKTDTLISEKVIPRGDLSQTVWESTGLNQAPNRSNNRETKQCHDTSSDQIDNGKHHCLEGQ